MAVQPPLYQLFHLRPSAAQTSVDALVSGLWCRLFPGQYFGKNQRLDQMFLRRSHWPELATLKFCPYYFDQVTYRLPTRGQAKHMESCNLRLHWFNSWADLEQERQRATGQHGRRNLRPNQAAQNSTGIYLSRLSQLQDPNPGRSISTKEYTYLMCGYQR